MRSAVDHATAAATRAHAKADTAHQVAEEAAALADDIEERILHRDQIYGRGYVKRAATKLNEFLDVMEAQALPFTTVNGGWGGFKENSTGMPLIASLFGAVGAADQLTDGGTYLPPVIIMPQVGAFDRLPTIDTAHTYFEVPGCWGDDSKYLVAFSTGLLVMEPYGYWTNIEIANGVAQNKPVAIIADPAKLGAGKEYHAEMAARKSCGRPFIEKTIDLPGGRTGSYRIYEDAVEASRWIQDQSMLNMRALASSCPPSPVARAAHFYSHAEYTWVSSYPMPEVAVHSSLTEHAYHTAMWAREMRLQLLERRMDRKPARPLYVPTPSRHAEHAYETIEWTPSGTSRTIRHACSENWRGFCSQLSWRIAWRRFWSGSI